MDNLIVTRQNKLDLIRKSGNPYPNDFRRDSLAKELHDAYDKYDNNILLNEKLYVTIAGRLIARRIIGKLSFVQLRDMSGDIQLVVRSSKIGEELYKFFKNWDIGDIIGAHGQVCKTNTGELSVDLTTIRLLVKSLRPLPEKFHGLVDQEKRYRQRYLDLIVNPTTRKLFYLRSSIISYIRNFLNSRGFLEVETPMMHHIPGGAAARPFVTYHNTLDTKLYLRIAPELYLKKLVIGGLEKVYEINRNFRNEGLSTWHNPEFTMLEFYQAYSDYKDLMILSEELLRNLAQNITGSPLVTYQGELYDFSKSFRKMTVKEAILFYNPNISLLQIEDIQSATKIIEKLGINLSNNNYGLGRLQMEIFDLTVIKRLREPTFITEYPTEVSPLAKSNNENHNIADRFEFFIGGHEIANGFSELNDPSEQALRFQHQAAIRANGDDEAMYYDADYIRSLEYGLPPTAGEGIGIDRLVMIFANVTSIRDVLLFPYMRAE